MEKMSHWQATSWSAIFSGVLTGFGINFLFNLCMLSFGIAAFNLTGDNQTVLSCTGLIAYLILSVITMFATGWVAGRLTPPIFKKFWGALMGFIAWALLLLVTIVVLTNMIQFTAFHSTFTSHPNIVAIRIANDRPFMTETKEASSTKSPLDVNLEKTTKVITLNAFITFILFLIGAFSSCVGGYLGYRQSRLMVKKNL